MASPQSVGLSAAGATPCTTSCVNTIPPRSLDERGDQENTCQGKQTHASRTEQSYSGTAGNQQRDPKADRGNQHKHHSSNAYDRLQPTPDSSFGQAIDSDRKNTDDDGPEAVERVARDGE